MSLLQRHRAWRQGRFALACLFGVACIAACSSTQLTDKIDYGKAPPPKPLDIPPDLSQLPKDDRFQVPSVTASSVKNQQQAVAPAQQATIVPGVPNARMERDGSQRWLAVDLPPELVIEQVRATFKDAGLTIERDDPKMGIIETVWAENHARLPLDWLRKALGSAADTFYSTSELDKFRARIERTAGNTTEVFVSHRGMQEVYIDKQHDQTIWQLRPSEPELEAEILRRMQLRFLPDATAKAAPVDAAATKGGVVAAAAPPPNARLVPGSDSGDTKVQIDEPFDRAWRRVGVALDRGGFTVEDRDRTKGLYYVRYIDPDYEAKVRDKQGFFAKLFGRDPKIEAQQFRILVAGDGGSGTDVRVQDKDGNPERSATGAKILTQITEQLR
ncbi:MAG TPA: outer membrane protein assembly factor BamC [Burkholderiaceae bacterium]|nr:outer membrane protein assembly factor BamC [Burkholderiaceae bacterium]